MHKLAQLSAHERQRIIDEFVDDTFAGIEPDAPGATIAQGMRGMPAELPDDPSAEQVDAWVELAELVADPAFRQRVREMATTGARGATEGFDPTPVFEHAGGALAEGIAPESEEGRTILHRIVAEDMPGEQRRALADTLGTFTDRRVERYWQLLGVINGWPAREPQVPPFEWLIAALRAHS